MCTTLIFGVFFPLLKQELISILKVTLVLTLSLAPALGASQSRHGSVSSPLADIQDKEDTQLSKVRCLLKMRQNLRGFISFIFRPTPINPHSKTISATVLEGSSNGSKLPLYIQERRGHNTDLRKKKKTLPVSREPAPAECGLIEIQDKTLLDSA